MLEYTERMFQHFYAYLYAIVSIYYFAMNKNLKKFCCVRKQSYLCIVKRQIIDCLG